MKAQEDKNGNAVWGVLCAIGVACIVSLAFIDKPPMNFKYIESPTSAKSDTLK
jgi:hypothetical protein